MITEAASAHVDLDPDSVCRASDATALFAPQRPEDLRYELMYTPQHPQTEKGEITSRDKLCLINIFGSLQTEKIVAGVGCDLFSGV